MRRVEVVARQMVAANGLAVALQTKSADVTPLDNPAPNITAINIQQPFTVLFRSLKLPVVRVIIKSASLCCALR